MRPPSKPLPVNQEEFERAVVASICRYNPALADIIAEQIRLARITDRWGSGCGFFVDYQVSPKAPRLPKDVPHVIDCEGFELLDFDCNPGGGMFFHSDGLISMLECWCCGNNWPTNEYVFKFFDNEARN